MISHERRCIFVHIPRTGGSSIEQVLWPGERRVEDLWMGFVSPYANQYQTGGLQHLTASLVRSVVGERVFDTYYKFAVVRNPWDKAVSCYTYLRQRSDLRDYLGMEEDASFKTFLELAERRLHVQWQPQCSFVYDEQGQLLVDDVFRFETIERDIEAAFARLGVAASLPHTNASVRGPLAAYYGEEERLMVARLFADDIRRFGYAFPE